MIGIVAGSLVIVSAGYTAVYVNNSTNRELVTLTKCISASGFYVPFIITFKNAYYFCKYFKNEMDKNILFFFDQNLALLIIN